jgi:hypothetical protein
MAVNVGQGAPALAELIVEFQKNEKTLHLITRQSLPENAPDMRLVVVVDQFEEVFTLCRKEELVKFQQRYEKRHGVLKATIQEPSTTFNSTKIDVMSMDRGWWYATGICQSGR